MKNKHYLTFALLLVTPIGQVYAQDEADDLPLAYGYHHTIDLSLGTGTNLKGYSSMPDHGVGLFGHNSQGVDFSLRYTRFASPHWGWFAQINLLNLSNSPAEFERQLARHYNHGSHEVRVDYSDPSWINDIGSSYDIYLAGIAYRYDFDRWSFRSRFGMGLISQDYQHVNYYVVDVSTTDSFESFSLKTTDQHGKYQSDFNAFAYSPQFQVAYSVSTHFFFSAEVQWTGTIGHLYQHTKAAQYRASEPQDWEPAIDGYFHIYSPCTLVRKTDDHLNRVQMGNFLQFRFGVGWNIGHNRNAKRVVK